MKNDHSVEQLCQMLEVSVSGYYDWAKRQASPGPRAREDGDLACQIAGVHESSRRTYGSPRIVAALRAQGRRHGRNRVARLMRLQGLRGRQASRYRPRTTESRHSCPIALNRLAAAAPAGAPNQIWVADIAYISTGQGWLYLAAVGELWQHDSSIHAWWQAEAKQTLLLTVDDHSRRYLGATFVPTDTTWNHFEHFRRAFLKHGRAQALYTDGLALFGYQSSTDGRDPRSEFQRALTALGISHLVAPSPEAKGKIERRFGTFQNRLLALLAFEQITRYDPAPVVLDHELERQNRTICRTTGLSPDDAWNKALEEGRDVMRPAPESSLLDLHLSLHFGRRRNADHQIDFLGRSWEIAPTSRHTVTVIHHPNLRFWIVSTPPKPPENRWPDVLAKYSL